MAFKAGKRAFHHSLFFRKNSITRGLGKKWEGLGASFPFVVKAISCRDVRRHI